MSERAHISVMTEEFLRFFKDKALKVFFEGTVGAGGHAELLLAAHPEIETYIACDKDPEALELAKERLKSWKEKVHFVQGDFADLDQHLSETGVKSVDGFFLISESPLCN